MPICKNSPDMFSLKGKSAVVIGGAGGIGQAIAEAYAMFGAKVMIASRNVQSLERAVSEIKANVPDADVSYHPCDAAKVESIQDLFDHSVKTYGKVDILCCSQGFNKKFDFDKFDMDVWDSMYQVNVRSVMLACQRYGRHMKDNGYGKIVVVSSVRDARGCGGGNAGYCSTKGAVGQLIRTLAVELGPEVTINGIGPTITYTPMMVGLMPADEKERDALAANKPLQRIGRPEDCSGAAVYLAAPASDFTTGHIIYPDGGLMAIG